MPYRTVPTIPYRANHTIPYPTTPYHTTPHHTTPHHTLPYQTTPLQSIYVADDDEHCVWRLFRAGNGGFVAEKHRASRSGAPSTPGRAAQIARAAQQISLPVGLGSG